MSIPTSETLPLQLKTSSNNRPRGTARRAASPHETQATDPADGRRVRSFGLRRQLHRLGRARRRRGAGETAKERPQPFGAESLFCERKGNPPDVTAFRRVFRTSQMIGDGCSATMVDPQHGPSGPVAEFICFSFSNQRLPESYGTRLLV